MQVGDGSDAQINLAIKRGVANGDFLQPKGKLDLYLRLMVSDDGI